MGAHQELAEACVGSDAGVIVSGYASELWDGMLGDWYRYEIPMLTSQGSGDGRRTEIVWSNRALEGLGDEGEFPLQDEPGVTETQHRCVGCQAVLRHPKRGRRRVWCSEACRIAGWRARRDVEGVEDDEVAVSCFEVSGTEAGVCSAQSHLSGSLGSTGKPQSQMVLDSAYHVK